MFFSGGRGLDLGDQGIELPPDLFLLEPCKAITPIKRIPPKKISKLGVSQAIRLLSRPHAELTDGVIIRVVAKFNVRHSYGFITKDERPKTFRILRCLLQGVDHGGARDKFTHTIILKPSIHLGVPLLEVKLRELAVEKALDELGMESECGRCNVPHKNHPFFGNAYLTRFH